MIKLGVSLYPEKETVEEIDSYLKLASSYGFTKVFTSLFSVPGTPQEVADYFRGLTGIAHKYHMEVYADCNAKFFMACGATPEDLSYFKYLGLDVLRLDLMFKDERDVAVVNNDQGLGVQLNASVIDSVRRIIENGGMIERMIGSYNFYPMRYTGAGIEDVARTNAFFKSMHIPTQAFISSNRPGAHGPWPVSDGLPTIEACRDMPVSLQLRLMIALGCDEVFFGNAFATEEEFKTVQEVLNQVYVTTKDQPFYFEGIRQLIPIGPVERIPLTIRLDEGITETERDILFNFDKHCVSEYTHLIIRSRWGRFDYHFTPVEVRANDREYLEPGDVVILNDNIPRYKAEVHIVKQRIKNIPMYNYVGTILPEEMILVDQLKEDDCFTFIEG